MKIKLLTFSGTPNYGALLQTYALCEVLGSWGHQVDLLKVLLYKPSLKNTLRCYLYDRFMLRFQKHYLPAYVKIGDIDREAVYIVGSDQVWNPHFMTLHGLLFFFDFLPDEVKRISYAASFGEQDLKYTDRIKERIRALLSKFSAVSVRESFAVEVCRENFKIVPGLVLDPTLLLTDYSRISGPVTKQNTLVSFKFVQSPEYDRLLEILAGKSNLKINRLDRKFIKIRNKGYINRHVSVNDWVKAIAECEMLVTDSFHGVAFALIHRKQFIVLPSVKSRMGRVVSLLRLLGIVDRYYDSVDEVYRRLDRMELIDYKRVGGLLDKERERSLRFLQNSLSR